MVRSKHALNISWLVAVMIISLGVVGCGSSSQAPEAQPTIKPAEVLPTETSQTPLPLTEVPEKLGTAVAVPAGSEVSIDGVLSPDEWKPAMQLNFGEDSQLLLMHTGGYLYLGVKSKPEPVTSICLDQPGQVLILHSSASIGTARYSLGDGTWDLVSGFEWCCRDATDSGQAAAEREDHLKLQGWIASNGRMGRSEEVEFQIALPGDSIRLAVNSLGAPDYKSVASWPDDLDDECSNPVMLTGPIPEQAQFSLEDWITLTLSAD